jgi:hypothetical protein
VTAPTDPLYPIVDERSLRLALLSLSWTVYSTAYHVPAGECPTGLRICDGIERRAAELGLEISAAGRSLLDRVRASCAAIGGGS